MRVLGQDSILGVLSVNAKKRQERQHIEVALHASFCDKPGSCSIVMKTVGFHQMPRRLCRCCFDDC